MHLFINTVLLILEGIMNAKQIISPLIESFPHKIRSLNFRTFVSWYLSDFQGILYHLRILPKDQNNNARKYVFLHHFIYFVLPYPVGSS